MADFDLFNGDADGIFSLLQLRAVDPRPNAEVVTGVKRDIALFGRISGRTRAGDRVTALDISMARNTEGLLHVLESGARVFYVDHHQTGDIPDHPGLHCIADTSAVTCTAFLVDRHLEGAQAAWAVCGAYGDNFPALAERIAAERGLALPLGRLRELGELVNYNAYGQVVEDLHIHPATLFATLSAYPGPVAFLDAEPAALETLREGFAADWDVAQGARTLRDTPGAQVLVLPRCAASSRIGGLFGNALVDEEPDRAFAILTEAEGGFRASIRAPRGAGNPSAAALAAQFGGGGRRAAAGIDTIAHAQLDVFVDRFTETFR